MASAAKSSARSLGARLQAKVGPLPVWAWAAVILGIVLVYMRTHSTGSTPATPTATTSGVDSGAQVPVSGAGGPGDNLPADLVDQLNANTSALDALTFQILSQPTPYGQHDPLTGAPASDTSAGIGPASTPTPQAPAHPASVGAPPAAHPTQTASGVLKWGGLSFTTKAAFDSWARSHGSSTAAELQGHPQARGIYSTLK